MITNALHPPPRSCRNMRNPQGNIFQQPYTAITLPTQIAYSLFSLLWFFWFLEQHFANFLAILVVLNLTHGVQIICFHHLYPVPPHKNQLFLKNIFPPYACANASANVVDLLPVCLNSRHNAILRFWVCLVNNSYTRCVQNSCCTPTYLLFWKCLTI